MLISRRTRFTTHGKFKTRDPDEVAFGEARFQRSGNVITVRVDGLPRAGTTHIYEIEMSATELAQLVEMALKDSR